MNEFKSLIGSCSIVRFNKSSSELTASIKSEENLLHIHWGILSTLLTTLTPTIVNLSKLICEFAIRLWKCFNEHPRLFPLIKTVVIFINERKRRNLMKFIDQLTQDSATELHFLLFILWYFFIQKNTFRPSLD